MTSGLLVFILFFLAGAQSTGSVEGVVVRVGTNIPVAGARVSMGAAQTTTDPNGMFAFQNIQPGRYRLIANHLDYVPASYIERKGLGRATEVTVGFGEAVRDVVLVLTPNGAISGSVYDPNGKVVSGVTIDALKQAYQDGRRILVSVKSTQSNKLGEYSLPSLAPGPYIIRATLPGSRNSEIPPVYFPNTGTASLASIVELSSGLTMTGVDVTMTERHPVRISGTVINAVTREAVPGALVTLVPRRGTVATGTLQRATVSTIGAFEFRRMAPGAYDLVATIRDPVDGQLANSTPLDIIDDDIDDVSLILRPQLTVDGKVRIENGQDPPLGFNLQAVRVELRREPYTPELLIPVALIAPDGTFTLTGITPGDYQLKITPGTSKGYVKAARFGSIDALNPPFHIGGSGQFDIVIGLHPAAVDAIVLDGSAKPVPDATVVLVPDPPHRERYDIYYSGSSDASGRHHFDSVTPGEYRVFAWDDVPADAWEDSDFLRLYEERGRRVRVAEGNMESVELRLISR